MLINNLVHWFNKYVGVSQQANFVFYDFIKKPISLLERDGFFILLTIIP